MEAMATYGLPIGLVPSKYFWTVHDEFTQTRAAFRNRQVVGCARVAASEYGTRAAGYEEACRLLGCEV